MGGKGSGFSSESAELSREQAALARSQRALSEEQAAISKPLRTGTAGILNQFLTTGQTPSFLDLPQSVVPTAAIQLPGLEKNQLDLRKALIAQGSRGGLLQQQLAQGAIQGGLARADLQANDIYRQQQRDELRSGISRALFGGASDFGTGGLSLAFQGLNSSMGGLGNAAGNLNTLGAQRITQNQIAQQGIGQLVGKAAGGTLGFLAGGPQLGAAGAMIGSGTGNLTMRRT